MSVFEELEKCLEDQGIVQISGGVFKDHESPTGKKYKANTTVKQYCNALGEYNDVSGEEYALELLAMQQAIAAGKGQLVVGECRKCWAFILENEEHVCKEDSPETEQERQKADKILTKTLNRAAAMIAED